MADTVGGLLPQGELVTIGVTPEPLPISPAQLITPGLRCDRPSFGNGERHRGDNAFRAFCPVCGAWIEELPLAQAAEGYAALEKGRAHYRTVLTM